MNWLDVLTLVIAGLTFLVALYTLFITLKDRKEHCQIRFYKGFGNFNVADGGGFWVETEVPGYEIAVINPGKQPLYIESVYLCAEEWEDNIQVRFHSKMTFIGHGWSGGESFLIDPRRKVKSSVSMIDLLEKTEQQHIALSDLHIWVEVALEPGRTFHTKKLAVSKALLEQAQADRARLTTK